MEERPIQIGDIVETNTRSFVIDTITDTDITVRYIHSPKKLFHIINDNGVWKIKNGGPVSFTSRENFRISMNVTPKLDIKILNNLSDEYLEIACKEKSYLGKLCNDQTLWIRRTEKYFPGAPIRVGNKTPKQTYFLLKAISDGREYANYAAGTGLIDLLNWMKKVYLKRKMEKNKYLLPDQHGANWAAQEGKIESLEWMKNENLPLPNLNGANLAIRNNHPEVVKWMRDNVPGFTYP